MILRQWSRLAALDMRDRRELFFAIVVLSCTRIGVATCGFNWTRRRLASLAGEARQESRRPAEVTVALVDRAARATRATCLTRSLTLWALLRRDGCGPIIRFGARSGSGTVEAHAWVECGGKTFDTLKSVDSGTFVPFRPRHGCAHSI